MSSNNPIDTSWKTNNFTYGIFESGDIDNVPLLDIVRGNIVLAQLDGSGNITNNPTAFFILTTSKINNVNNFPNVPSTAYQQFMLVQGNSKNFGPTSGSVPNGQNNSNFYFSPFVSQVTDLVPLYAKYDATSDGIEFFRADIFIDATYDYKYSNFIIANPDFLPNINSLPNPLGKNENEFVYLCTKHYYNAIANDGTYTYSVFNTKADIASNPVINDNYIYLRTTYKFNNLTSKTSIATGIKYTPINVYPNGVATFTNFLTSLGGTVSGGSSNNTNVSMGFENSNVFYQNDIQNYIGTYYNTDEPYWFSNWSIDARVFDTNPISFQNYINAGTTNFMAFQFIPLTYLINPGPGRVPTAPSYLNLTYPPFFGPPQPYPSPLPNVNGINYVAPANVQAAITNWYGNTTSVACSTKVISNSFCGFTPQYYYNSLQGEFYTVEENPVCGPTFDPPADTTDVGAGTVAGFSKSCGNTAACVPNFAYDIDPAQSAFICGPPGAKFDSTDYYAMEYNNFINYFYVLPSTGIPYSLTSFTPQPYIDTEKISQNSEGTPKTTFWNSSVFILLAVIFFVLILGFIVFFIYKQNKAKNPFPNYLNKYYS